MARPRSEKARQAVLSAMRRALAEDTYAATTIEGLAAEAGVSKQTIYRWWPSKAAVLGEALLEGELPGSDAVVPTSDDLAADLRAWFASVSAGQSDASTTEVARALIAVTATDPELGLVLNERLAAPIRAWVASRMRQAVADGDVREDVDADALADQFIAVASYAALLGQPLSEQRVDALVQMVMRGIGRD